MSRLNDRDYHQARARDELLRTQEASDPAVAAAHRQLAALHRRKLFELLEMPEIAAPERIPRLSPNRAS